MILYFLSIPTKHKCFGSDEAWIQNIRASPTPLHNLLQNGVMNKQKINYSLFCLFITPFPTLFYSKLWSGVGYALSVLEATSVSLHMIQISVQKRKVDVRWSFLFHKKKLIIEHTTKIDIYILRHLRHWYTL